MRTLEGNFNVDNHSLRATTQLVKADQVEDTGNGKRGIFGIMPNRETHLSPLPLAPERIFVQVVRIKGDAAFCLQLAGIGIILGSKFKMRRVGSHCLIRTQRLTSIVMDLKNAAKIIVR